MRIPTSPSAHVLRSRRTGRSDSSRAGKTRLRGRAVLPAGYFNATGPSTALPPRTQPRRLAPNVHPNNFRGSSRRTGGDPSDGVSVNAGMGQSMPAQCPSSRGQTPDHGNRSRRRVGSGITGISRRSRSRSSDCRCVGHSGGDACSQCGCASALLELGLVPGQHGGGPERIRRWRFRPARGGRRLSAVLAYRQRTTALLVAVERPDSDPRSESPIGTHRHLVVATARTAPLDGTLTCSSPGGTKSKAHACDANGTLNVSAATARPSTSAGERRTSPHDGPVPAF
jgi:hypothetical protein